MRSAILDIGSNSAHLKVVDLEPGGPIRTVASIKEPTRLAGAISVGGRIGRTAMDRVVASVAAAGHRAVALGAEELIAFATSAIRDAANRDEVVERVATGSGIEIGFLSGHDEARLTFLAARAWYGWAAGALLLADIGGGSLEIAAGDGAEPETAESMPLGAGRLTREHLPGDPPSAGHVERLREHVAGRLAAYGVGRLTDRFPDRYPVATSKIFLQLAKLTRGTEENGRRVLERRALQEQILRLAGLTACERARLKGVSESRARQILAGAIVAEEVMTALGLSRVEICPWALREGIALRRLQQLRSPFRKADDIGHLLRPLPAGRPPPASAGRGGSPRVANPGIGSGSRRTTSAAPTAWPAAEARGASMAEGPPEIRRALYVCTGVWVASRR